MTNCLTMKDAKYTKEELQRTPTERELKFLASSVETNPNTVS